MHISHYSILTIKAFGVLTVALISYILYKFIVVPLWRLRFYKKQGYSYSFFPLVGSMRKDQTYEKEKNDVMGYYKELPKLNPNIPLIISNVGSQPDIILFDPKLIKEFYSQQSLYKKAFGLEPLTVLMGTGLFLAEGNTWKAHRKVISTIFHFEFIRDKIPTIIEIARDVFGKLAKSDLKSVNVLEEIQKITGEVIGKIFFSENLNKYSVEGKPLTVHLAKLIFRTGMIFQNPLLLFLTLIKVNAEWIPSYGKFMKDIREFRLICHRIIKDRKESGVKTHDLLGLLLETQNSANPEDRFSDEDIINEFTTFFAAGMDSTAHVCTLTVYMLTRNPECLKNLENEIETIYGQTGTPSIEVLNKMEYLHGIIRETLRFYTPSPGVVPREAQVDHTLGELKIKKGTIVRPNPLYSFFSPKYFEEPDTYKPERWLSRKEQELSPFVFIPFSAGARNCIGQHLAMIEAKIILAEFIKVFRFKVIPEDFNVKMIFFSFYGPKEPIILELKNK